MSNGNDTPAPASNVAETVPAPPTFNAANGITSTQEFLENVLQPESAQQGQPAANAPVSISNLPPASLQAYRWE
jgi:hypothetical protein